ncbi:hypothetical protein HK405_009419 [Cladochytrium tenue]|nr:hypothetical protein HK405_009419 [Cladochytrium tenue]
MVTTPRAAVISEKDHVDIHPVRSARPRRRHVAARRRAAGATLDWGEDEDHHATPDSYAEQDDEDVDAISSGSSDTETSSDSESASDDAEHDDDEIPTAEVHDDEISQILDRTSIDRSGPISKGSRIVGLKETRPSRARSASASASASEESDDGKDSVDHENYDATAESSVNTDHQYGQYRSISGRGSSRGRGRPPFHRAVDPSSIPRSTRYWQHDDRDEPFAGTASPKVSTAPDDDLVAVAVASMSEDWGDQPQEDGDGGLFPDTNADTKTDAASTPAKVNGKNPAARSSRSERSAPSRIREDWKPYSEKLRAARKEKEAAAAAATANSTFSKDEGPPQSSLEAPDASMPPPTLALPLHERGPSPSARASAPNTTSRSVRSGNRQSGHFAQSWSSFRRRSPYDDQDGSTSPSDQQWVHDRFHELVDADAADAAATTARPQSLKSHGSAATSAATAGPAASIDQSGSNPFPARTSRRYDLGRRDAARRDTTAATAASTSAAPASKLESSRPPVSASNSGSGGLSGTGTPVATTEAAAAAGGTSSRPRQNSSLRGAVNAPEFRPASDGGGGDDASAAGEFESPVATVGSEFVQPLDSGVFHDFEQYYYGDISNEVTIPSASSSASSRPTPTQAYKRFSAPPSTRSSAPAYLVQQQLAAGSAGAGAVAGASPMLYGSAITHYPGPFMAAGAQPILTGSGHVVVMTESGLMVPTEGYMYPTYVPFAAPTTYPVPDGAVYYPPPPAAAAATTGSAADQSS